MQIGEYELTFIDVAVFVVFLVALNKIVKRMLVAKINEPAKYEIEQLEERDMTMEEIESMRREENRCLVIVEDKIYDLSGSQDLYDNNRDLFESSEGCGPEWAPICARKYPFVGHVLKN